MKKFFKNSDSNLMIEVIVALGLVIISLLGIVNLLSKSFYFNFETYNRFIATNLAIEGIEIAKNIIDTTIATSSSNWNRFNEGIYELDYNSFNFPTSFYLYNSSIDKKFFKDNQNYFRFLKFNSTTKKYNYIDGHPTNFKRIIALKYLSYSEDPTQLPDNKIIKINSYVYWIYKNRDYLINLEDNFYKWR